MVISSINNQVSQSATSFSSQINSRAYTSASSQNKSTQASATLISEDASTNTYNTKSSKTSGNTSTDEAMVAENNTNNQGYTMSQGKVSKAQTFAYSKGINIRV